MPTTASTTAWVQKPSAGMVASAIAMISADRMKSVLIALATFWSSSACGSAAAGASLASWACAWCGKIAS